MLGCFLHSWLLCLKESLLGPPSLRETSRLNRFRMPLQPLNLMVITFHILAQHPKLSARPPGHEGQASDLHRLTCTNQLIAVTSHDLFHTTLWELKPVFYSRYCLQQPIPNIYHWLHSHIICLSEPTPKHPIRLSMHIPGTRVEVQKLEAWHQVCLRLAYF